MHKTHEDRQQEAIERQLARNTRTDTDQLTLIRHRPGRSLKETARLMCGTPMLVATNDDLFIDYDVECPNSGGGYHIWRAVLAEDMYECEACGLIDC